MRRCIYLLVKQSNKRTVIKNQPKENGENPIISQYVVKLPNLISRISVTPFQKHPFADVLQSRCSWISQVFVIYTIFTNIQVFVIYTKCFPLKILQFLWTAFFIEHLWWLPLPFTSSFRSYYWEDLLVIWFTLTHPRLWLNAGLKLITKKIVGKSV